MVNNETSLCLHSICCFQNTSAHIVAMVQADTGWPAGGAPPFIKVKIKKPWSGK